MDPRIRERRIAVQRDLGRRRLRMLLSGLAALAVVAAGYGITRSPLFDVDRVRVLGATRTTPDAIALAGGLSSKPQLGDVDEGAVAAKVERLPWVHDARVVRHWPGTVEITLLERSPLATLPASAGGWAVVDRSGRVLEVTPEPAAGMVQVHTGPAPAPGARVGTDVRGGLAVLEALPPSLGERVNGMTIAEDGTVDLHAQGLPVIHFGPTVQIRPKLVAIATLVARTELKGVRAIDVRAPTAPVLTRG